MEDKYFPGKKKKKRSTAYPLSKSDTQQPQGYLSQQAWRIVHLDRSLLANIIDHFSFSI
jgi:hypothetical protein